MNHAELIKLTKLLRYDILTSTTEAGSGHPTSSLSAVELMTALWFDGHYHYDFDDPNYALNDRFILSKGHASPLLYSLYHVAGQIEYEELTTLRKFTSRLEGHPTNELPWVDVATGSLGQGLSVGVGMALAIKLHVTRCALHVTRLPKVYVLMGDSEFAEGQVYEALQLASYYKLNNLVGILDVNRLGQRGETMLGWDIKTYEERIKSFGWNTIVVENGNNLDDVCAVFSSLNSLNSPNSPTMIIAKTKKGAGISSVEDKDGWHGKPLPKVMLDDALKELGEVDVEARGEVQKPEKIDITSPTPSGHPLPEGGTHTGLPYEGSTRRGRDVPIFTTPTATREAYGAALKLIAVDERVVVLDAETSNSTFSETMKKIAPERFFEMFIAEQNMVSVALGLTKIGFVPFASSFSAFLSRAYDQIRMAHLSLRLNGASSEGGLNIIGSHAGVSIGEDGASQMALEDIAMMRALLHCVVLYPSDPVSTIKLVEELRSHKGMAYLRLTRAKTETLYDKNETFPIGGSKVLVSSESDVAVVIGAGITVHESLKAQKTLKEKGINIAVIDAYSVKPIDKDTIVKFAHKTGHVIVVEDHYPDGGLGDAVLQVLADIVIPDKPALEKSGDRESSKSIKFTHLAVRKTPRSGTPAELLRFECIDAEAIVKVFI